MCRCRRRDGQPIWFARVERSPVLLFLVLALLIIILSTLTVVLTELM